MIMNERHEKLLKLYKIFLEICQKHDIKFYFTGGSALGAVRHQGFIPWDDDIDMGVMRDEWERLKPILQKELPEDLTYVDYMTHPTYAGHICKIVDKNSVDLYRSRLADGTPKGQFLEIFILDPVPADKIEYHREMFWIYSEIMTPYFPYINTNIKHHNFSMRKYRYYKFLAKILGKDKVIKMIEEKIFNYKKEECDYLLLEWGAVINYYPIGDFGEPQYIKFEDTVAPVGARPAAQFYRDYGDDWMKYPDISGQMAHVTIGNAHTPAEEYMKDIFTRVNVKTTNEMRVKVKDNTIRDFRKNVEMSREMLNFKANHLIHKMNSKESVASIKALYEAKEFDAVYASFDEFFNLIKRGSKVGLVVKLNMELQECALMAAIALGKLKMSNFILDNMMQSGNVPKDKVEFFKKYIHLFEEIRIEYYDGEFELAKNMLEQVKDQFGNSYMFTTMDVRNRIKQNKISDASADIKKIDELIEKYPSDYDLVKIKADLLLVAGEEAKAIELYEEVLANSNNGIDILDIESYMKG